MPTATDIARELQCYLSPEEAARRGQMVAEDMAAIGFPLRISREVSAVEWRARGARPQAEYLLPATQFDINAEDGHQAMAGSSLTRGNLLRLSHAVDLGRRWLPKLWPEAFATQLLGAEHLDTLNEIWWLKFWSGLVAVQRGPKQKAASPDADWLLTIHYELSACTINLEVKRRTSNLNAWFKHGNPNLPLRDITKKFSPARADTANVAAITLFRPPSVDSVRSAKDWIRASPEMDGLVIWIEHSRKREPMLKLFKPEKRWAELLVAPPEPEDLMVDGLTLGTLCLPNEVPAFLDHLAREHRHDA